MNPLDQRFLPEKLQWLIANHELYIKQISSAHWQYLRFNVDGRPRAMSRHQRVNATFILERDDFYAGHVWFPHLIRRATDSFLRVLRGLEQKRGVHDRSDWYIARCSMTVLESMPCIPENGVLQVNIEASVVQWQDYIKFALVIAAGGKQLVRITEGIARPLSGALPPSFSAWPLPSNRNVQLTLKPDDLKLWHVGRLDVIFDPMYADVAAHVRTPSVPTDPDGWREITIDLLTDQRIDVTGIQSVKDPVSINMIGGALDQAFYLAMVALSYSGMTLRRDGWRIEPLPGHTMKLELAGDAGGRDGHDMSVLSHLHHTALTEDPIPMLFATVTSSHVARSSSHQGESATEAMQEKRMPLMQIQNFAVTLVPDYPIFDPAIHPQGLAGTMAGPQDERAFVVGGMRYDAQAMLHCSWGKPSAGFGPQFQSFDTSGRVSRLPGPPYQFISRISDIRAKTGKLRPGATLTVEYDIPSSAWYFEENAGVMPYAVLMEAVLQPCGWLSVYLGIPMQTEEPLFVRNLDGTGTQYGDITPDSGVLRTTVTLKNISRANRTFLHTYDIESTLDGNVIYRGETTFGHFPQESLKNQVGLAPDHVLTEDIAQDDRPPLDRVAFELETEPNRKLNLIDQIVQYDPVGGCAGRGRVVAEKSVMPDAWFFKAHFFQDPVQPGSLGIEAMLDVLKWVMKEKGLNRSFIQPRFEAIRTNHPMTWKYRGHVLPTNRLIRIVVDLLEEGKDDAGVYVVANAMLVVDDLPIYRANSIGMRIVETASQPDQSSLILPSDMVSLSNRRSYWARQTGIEEWIVFDIYESLFQRFVGQINIVDPPALKQLEKNPALYLANHQTAVESPIFNYVFSALQEIPLVGLAKDEHRRSWLGKLMDLAAGYPGVQLMSPMKFIERDNHMSALDLLKDLGRSMQRDRFSTLIHVEGTRSTHAGRPVETVSSTIIDSAVEFDIPIIPVRFSGGLPVTDEGVRHEFPFGFSKQDYWIGPPIHAASLAKRSILDRKSTVLEAINQLGPPAYQEIPSSAAEPEFEDQVNLWQTRFGVAREWAVILKCLEESDEKSDQTAQFLEFVRGKRKSSLSDSEHAWFTKLFEVMKGSGHGESNG